MSVPGKRRGAFVQAAFEVLAEADGRLPRREVERRVRARFELNEFENSGVPGKDLTQFELALYRALNPASSVGWLKRNAGEWILTEDGREALANHPRTPEVFEASKARRRSLREGGGDSAGVDVSVYTAPEIDYTDKELTMFTRESATVNQLVSAIDQGTVGPRVAGVVVRAGLQRVPQPASPQDVGVDPNCLREPLTTR